MIETININTKLYVKYIDNVKGFGVFANDIIKKDEIIEDCYSLLIHNTNLDYEPYYFYFKGDTKLLPLGFGCIYNHNNDPVVKEVIQIPMPYLYDEVISILNYIEDNPIKKIK